MRGLQSAETGVTTPRPEGRDPAVVLYSRMLRFRLTALFAPVMQLAKGNPSRHESFLVFSKFLYLRLALLLAVFASLLYVADRPYGTHYGGTLVGYTLGVAGTALICWLTWFGYRKRSYPEASGRLVGRLSAHVYFGLALLVIATLHTGFHFGWNVHTLAYALMCVVIASGILGVFCYARYPELITKNRAGMTMRQMLGSIATLDEQLRDAALPLDEETAQIVERAIETTAIGGSVWRQLTGRYPGCTTAAAIAHVQSRMPVLDPNREMSLAAEESAAALEGSGVDVEFVANSAPEAGTSETLVETARQRVRDLLDEKMALLARVRRDIRYKAFMDIWLYAHVPLSFMLLAALTIHIVSVFFLW